MSRFIFRGKTFLSVILGVMAFFLVLELATLGHLTPDVRIRFRHAHSPRNRRSSTFGSAPIGSVDSQRVNRDLSIRTNSDQESVLPNIGAVTPKRVANGDTKRTLPKNVVEAGVLPSGASPEGSRVYYNPHKFDFLRKVGSRTVNAENHDEVRTLALEQSIAQELAEGARRYQAIMKQRQKMGLGGLIALAPHPAPQRQP